MLDVGHTIDIENCAWATRQDALYPDTHQSVQVSLRIGHEDRLRGWRRDKWLESSDVVWQSKGNDDFRFMTRQYRGIDPNLM